MILTALEYSKIYFFENKKVSSMTIKRRCAKGMLPTGHTARKIPGAKGVWVIEVNKAS